MPITSNQDIPDKPIAPSQPWTFKSVFPIAALTKRLSELFTSPTEFFVGMAILFNGIGLIFGVNISWGFYFIETLLLLIMFYEHFIRDSKTKN